MPDIPGIIKPDLQALPTIRERMTFLYVERCLVNRQDSAVTITDKRGTAYVPASSLGVLMLGPGTNVSHRAIELLGDSGSSMVWVGEHGVRYYAHGRPLTRSSRLIVRQAELVSNTRKRLSSRDLLCSNCVGEKVLVSVLSIENSLRSIKSLGKGGNTILRIFRMRLLSTRLSRLRMYAYMVSSTVSLWR